MCSECETYQPIVRNLTVNQVPARTAKDVLGHELKCGHYFGNKDFMRIQKAVNKLSVEHEEHKRELELQFKQELSKTLAQLKTPEVKK